MVHPHAAADFDDIVKVHGLCVVESVYAPQNLGCQERNTLELIFRMKFWGERFTPARGEIGTTDERG